MADSWKAYLPEYRLPRFLSTCFGCFALLIIAGSVLIFMALPGIFNNINSLDTAPVIDVPLGSTVSVAGFSISVLRIENDTRCPGEAVCTPPGSVRVVFRSSLDGIEHSLEYLEGADSSDLVSLPDGFYGGEFGIHAKR